MMIDDHKIDLLLVQESYAEAEHLRPEFNSKARCRSVWERVENYRWGSAVVSIGGKLKPFPISGFSGWVVGAEIRGARWQRGYCDSILVFSVHAPCRKETYAKQVNKLLDEIRREADGRQVIIGGDFNITISHWSKSERPVSKQDLAIQNRLRDDFRLINCWQEANPEQPLAQTLRWTGDRTTAYHCDGLFVPKEWKDRLESCLVLAGEEWNRLSDHNPVVATFA